MTDTFTVGDLVAEFLQACGVETAFGVVSVHNIPMLDAIGRRNAIRFVMARGEAGAGHMADACGRVTGKLGVVFTSTGPGAANVPGALVEARFAGTPMLHLTGQTATGNLDRGQGAVHDVADQLGMLKSVSKDAFRVRSAETALGTLTQAAVAALTPPTGPVSVEIPIDIQRMPIKRPAALDDFVLPVPAPQAPDERLLDLVADMLAKAKRPLLWTGNGAKFAREPVERFLDLGIPLVTSWNGRGVVPEDHPMSLGPLYSTAQVQKFYETVDLMVVAGSRLRGHETGDLSMKLPERRVHIDVDPAADGRTYSCDLFLCGDAGLALDGIARRLGGRFKPEMGYGEEVASLKERTIAAYKDYLGPYGSFAEQMRAAMPEDAIWVRDVTLNNSTWGNRIFPLYGPRDSVYPVGAAIGPGVPLGIGAALGARGRKAVAMCGDGGFALSMNELWTARQENADVVFLVMNDKGYGVIKHIQDKLYGGRHYFADLQGPNFKDLAALAGMPYSLVDKADALGATVAKALAVNGPALVEVDMGAIGEFPSYFAPPPYAAQKS